MFEIKHSKMSIYKGNPPLKWLVGARKSVYFYDLKWGKQKCINKAVHVSLSNNSSVIWFSPWISYSLEACTISVSFILLVSLFSING